jgi:peptidoglycan/LPS O-acetylase OafA/YrhL
MSLHAVVLVSLLGLNVITNHCVDFAGPLAPAPWCDSYLQAFLGRIGVGTIAGAFFLFDVGLASAHVRAILANASASERSWAITLLSRWRGTWYTQGLVPACLILGGLSLALVPGDDLALPGLLIHNGRQEVFLIGASAIMLGVISCPQSVKEAMNNISFLGQLSFSMYLLHMSIIWSIGMPLYVWLSSAMTPDHAFGLIACVCAPCIYLVSAVFQQAIEEPLGVKLPHYAFTAIKWLLFDARKPRQQPEATQRMNDVLSRIEGGLDRG